jgi:two-component system, cell cycle sensor histidine kinase and response regulator CckA
MSAAAEVARPIDRPDKGLGSLFENSPIGLAVCQDPGNLTALNPALKRMLAIEPDVLQSLSLPDLIHAQDRSECERLMAELFAGRRESFQLDSRTTGASSRSLRWTAWRTEGKGGVPVSVLAMAEDLPGINVAEQRLRQAERLEAVGRLAGGVAHDFNNLLTGVLLYCDLLLASMEPLHRARHYAEEIRKAGLQATGLVRQLLAVARPATAQARLLSLNEIVEGMRTLLVRLIGENIELKQCLDPNLGLVKMDPTQAQQILLNLVLNARDAMPQGGVITLETRNCSVQILADSPADETTKASLPCALFVVEDNGSGMDESTRAHVFEPFFTTKGKGNGLGLATVHDIVTTNGGLIHVDSEVGRGTRVSVLLPLIPETLPESSTNSSYPARKEAHIHSNQEE